MAGITGLGGVFVKAGDTKELGRWYKEKLGLAPEDYGGFHFTWREAKDPASEGLTIFSLFDKDTDYFGEASRDVMMNFRVDDLDAYLAALKEAGVTVIDNREDSEFGRFAWIEDPEGNRIELWQPPEVAPASD